MPRLTTKQYLKAHHQLRRFWLHDQRLYAELTSLEQWQLHDYFKPDNDWPDEQLLEHRAAISKERPSLPHQAGRALSKFQAGAAQLALARVRNAKVPVATKRRRQSERHITVKAVVRPEIDVHKLARAFLAAGQDIAKRRHRRLGQSALAHAVTADFDRLAEPLSPRVWVTLRRLGIHP